MVAEEAASAAGGPAAGHPGDLEAGHPAAGDLEGEEADVPAEAEVAQEASKHRNQSCIAP